MGRSGLTEDDGDDPLGFGRYRGRVASAIRGKRGQRLLRDLRDALDAMPEKRLIANELVTEQGEVCALGALGVARGIDLKAINYEETDQVGAAFDVSPCLAAEIEFENDDAYFRGTPEERWQRMRKWVDARIRKDPEPSQ